MTFKFYGMTPQDAVTCILGGAFSYSNGQSAAVVQGLQWAGQLAELLRMQSARGAAGDKVSIKIATEGNPAGTPDAKVDASRLSPGPPPPFDSQEEARRAAGIWPQEAEPATVRPPKPSALDEMAAQAASWRVGVDLARDGADATAYMLRSHGEPIDFKNHQWLGIAIDHATKWKTAGGLQNLLMARHYLDKLIEMEGVSR